MSHFVKPTWFKESNYKRKLTLEQWLVEINKRFRLEQTFKEQDLSKTAKDDLFYKIIVKGDIPDIRTALIPKIPKAIKPISVAEVLIMASEILNSSWFKSFNEKEELINAVHKLSLHGISSLTSDEKQLLAIAKEIPWSEYKQQKEPWSLPPFFNNGIAVSINHYIAREDIEKELRKLLNVYQKPKTRSISDEIFKSWEEKKILQLFDLIVWFDIQQITVIKTELAQFLWPMSLPSKKNKDENANLIELLYEAEKLMKKAITLSTLQTLFLLSEQNMALKANM